MSIARWQRPYPYLLLAFFSLLLPSSFPVSHIKVGWSLIGVFFLPGYLVLALNRKRLCPNDNLFEKGTLALAVSLALLLVPWVLIFILRLDVLLAVAAVLVCDLALLLYLLVTNPPAPVTERRIPLALLFYIFVFVLLVYLLGGNVFGDGYSYMTWLRNIYVGDVTPAANIHAAWESDYPSYTNIFAPLLVGFAVCARMAQVDPNVVWATAPAFLIVFLFAINYSFAQLLFRKRLAASIAILITPLVMPYLPNLLGDSHGSAVFILAPLTIYMALRYMMLPDKRRADRLCLALVGPLGLVLAAEHLQNLVYVTDYEK